MSARRMTEVEKLASLADRLEAGSVLVPWCGCRIWLGATNESGYGVIAIGRSKRMKAHRAAYMLARGELPSGDGYHGGVIRHVCDVPACVNPDHLEPGSQADNISDTRTRNRVRHGSRHHGAKLTEQDIADILAAKGKETQTQIARRYGIYPSVISRIYSGEAWARAVQGELP